MPTSIPIALCSIGLVAVLASCASGASPISSRSAPPSPPAATPLAERTPSPTQPEGSSESPTTPPLTATFGSPIMGYSVRYPTGWTAHPATESWLPGASNFWDDPVGDRLEGVGVGFRGTSQALAKSQSASDWLKEYFGSSPGCGKREEVPVGDQVGTIDLNGCPGLGRLGGRVYDLAVVAGGRGYNFTMEGKVDHSFFVAMLATVKFDPKSAKGDY
jgi:hypothetical protein